MKGRGLAIATLALGAASIGVFVAFAMLAEARAAGACMPAGAVVQFELARNGEDLAAIFGASDASCGPRVIAAMDAINRLDLLAFIPTYTAFALAAALFLAGGALRPLSIAAAAAALGAAAGDYVETTTLLKITQTLDSPEALLGMSQAGAWSKFALLAAHALFCAGLCFLGERRRPFLGALLLLPTLGVAAAAYDHVRLANVMNGAFALAWLGVLAASARDLFAKEVT
ncbi:MAG: hypothetical protein ABL883_05705 [Terricaulis sp.]